MASKKFGNYDPTKFVAFKHPHKRHYIESLDKPKQLGNSVVIGIPKETILDEIAQIKRGESYCFGTQKNRFEVASGRIYGYHDRIFYPAEGPGIYVLSGSEYGLLADFLDDPSGTQIEVQYKIAKGKLSMATLSKVWAVVQLYQKMLESSQEDT